MPPWLKRSPKLLPWLWLIALLPSWQICAQETVTEYFLLPDSRLTDTTSQPIAGHFRLLLLPDPGPTNHYAVEDFSFTAGTGNWGEWHATDGTGTYWRDSQVTYTQSMTLGLWMGYLDMIDHVHFTNTTTRLVGPPSDMQLRLTHLDGLISQTLSIDLHAAAVTDIPLRIIQTDPSNVVLIWPASYGPGNVLHATRLTPLPDWQETLSNLKQVGDEFQATFPATDAAGFFRIHTLDNY